jgi:hypothetical protein
MDKSSTQKGGGRYISGNVRPRLFRNQSFLAAHRRQIFSNAANWTFNMAYFLTSGIFAYFWFRYSETKQNSKFVSDPK